MTTDTVRSGRGVATVLFALLTGAGALAGCANDAHLAPQPTVTSPARLSMASLPAGMSLQCLPSPFVSPRNVTAGSSFDDNGNGIVCDEQLGPPGAPSGALLPARTSDDFPLPTPTAPALAVRRQP